MSISVKVFEVVFVVCHGFFFAVCMPTKSCVSHLQMVNSSFVWANRQKDKRNFFCRQRFWTLDL